MYFDYLTCQSASVCLHRPDPLSDAAAVLAVREAVGPEVTLRADANGAWTIAQAVQFGKNVAGAGLEYIEDPTFDSCSFSDFYLETGKVVSNGNTQSIKM